MGIIGGEIGYKLLKKLDPSGEASSVNGSVYADKSKIETLLGSDIWREVAGKTVIDFGCGEGSEAVEMAQRGAGKVIGVDIQDKLLSVARDKAEVAGVNQICTFSRTATELADIIVSIDAFEHFADSAAMLDVMRGMLKPDGCIIASFGPTWYHPLGGHLFSVFPWAHLVFTEAALIRWRSDFKTDGATRFSETDGGLNQMTIRRFERIVGQSSFEFEKFEAVPIRKLRLFTNDFTREFTTAIVRCKLILKKRR